ncbi:MAG: hypothetical protein Q7T80_14720 [Methanoregula sp.]|nr:hypothetical protein [Methanoregula sp.]
MPVPDTIQPIVDKYTFHCDAYIRGQEKYTEAQLRQVEAADGAIDKLVYELYGLTEDEIKNVDGNKTS